MTISLFGFDIPAPSFGQLIFGMLSLVAIGSGLMMITRRDAVHSALWLVITFFQLAGLYVMLGAEFLAALQVLVYTGAILVLFLFVIMLLNLRETAGPRLGGIHTAQLIIAWPIGIILLLELATVILFQRQPSQVHLGDTYGSISMVWTPAQIDAVGGNVQALGQTLYTNFLFPFEVASLILLLAVLGAIVLARKEEPAELEEVLPSLGISLGRRSVSNSPQEEQIEKKLLPALGVRSAPDARADSVETPMVDQPTSSGSGTTSGVEGKPDQTAGTRR